MKTTMLLLAGFFALSAFGGARVENVSIALDKPKQALALSIAAEADTTVRAQLLFAGGEFNTAGWTGLLFYGESGGITLTNTEAGRGFMAWDIPYTKTPTNGRYTVQIFGSRGTRIEEWGRGALTVTGNPGKNALPADWVSSSPAYIVATNAEAIAKAARTALSLYPAAGDLITGAGFGAALTAATAGWETGSHAGLLTSAAFGNTPAAGITLLDIAKWNAGGSVPAGLVTTNAAGDMALVGTLTARGTNVSAQLAWVVSSWSNSPARLVKASETQQWNRVKNEWDASPAKGITAGRASDWDNARSSWLNSWAFGITESDVGRIRGNRVDILGLTGDANHFARLEADQDHGFSIVVYEVVTTETPWTRWHIRGWSFYQIYALNYVYDENNNYWNAQEAGWVMIPQGDFFNQDYTELPMSWDTPFGSYSLIWCDGSDGDVSGVKVAATTEVVGSVYPPVIATGTGHGQTSIGYPEGMANDFTMWDFSSPIYAAQHDPNDQGGQVFFGGTFIMFERSSTSGSTTTISTNAVARFYPYTP